jgi:hypothetical protein
MQFCEHVSSFFRSELTSPTANQLFKLSSQRLTSILDDCCSSIEMLKIHTLASFTSSSSSSSGHAASPAISQFLRLSCATAATSARMFAIACPPSIPHATAERSVRALDQTKVVQFHFGSSTNVSNCNNLTQHLPSDDAC